MIEIAIVAGLVLLNGVFAMSELAVVSARRALLRSMAERGNRGAASALALADDPGRFLSTVQIGITLIGIIAGAFSGATLGGALTATLAGLGLSPAFASALGYGGVVAIITYLSVVVGELVPKNFALRHAEAIACLVAPPMTLLSRVAGPVVWLLDSSTRALLRLFGMAEGREEVVTEEEIKAMVAQAAATGVIEGDEKRMIAGVLRLSDRTARAVMTPRLDIDALRLAQPLAELDAEIRRSRHARLPVLDTSDDDVLGVIVVREYLADPAPETPDALRAMIRPVPMVPETLGALEVLDRLREADQPMALVLDEYGHFEGLVTPADLLEAIAGVFKSDLDGEAQLTLVRREDGSWLIDGALDADEMAETLAITLPSRAPYQTVAGFMIHKLRRLPRTGEWVEAFGWRFEVVDMDGRRIDKILASPVSAQTGPARTTPPRP
ncbi:hemolysin family protein [Pelagibacterium montanilacus]|uniref:hemolysin family protein n=1 Tax=Pelagibacterium montanilacus TaxID=2185280 RepID=UPI000F8C89A9|nr:hemolysin family protein [Pelagibacterium montanilacus]